MYQCTSECARENERLCSGAVNMFCMILQLNPGTDQPVWTLWAELLMKSADGPLGGTVIPLHSPATGLIIGVFVAPSHSGCRQKDRELGLVAFTESKWSFSNKDKNAATMALAKNFICYE